ncbi:hypothetical protein F4604DRAFT_1945607 [Suillus subluteus]|nr:hypothetical protein F4604DRAFT_1945607 [Suillus subluteus]
MTLQGHKPSTDEQYPNGAAHHVSSISYFPDGQRMISGSWDGTSRQWDLRMGKEIEKARDGCEVNAVGVSRNGRWVVTAGGENNYEKYGELRACEVETGMVKTFGGRSSLRAQIICIDISADSTLLASGSSDSTARIYNLDTGRLVAGPFKSDTFNCGVGAVRFSQDSKKKLEVKSIIGKRLEIWDVHTQKLDAGVGKTICGPGLVTYAPVFWTTKDQTIIAAFSHDDHVKYDHVKTIYEFDTLTLKTIGAPFKGHILTVTGLALSSDGALLASASRDDKTIKLWAFDSRQLLASFHVRGSDSIILSHQLAYTTWCDMKSRIYICDTPPDILASIWPVQEAQPNINTFRNPRRPTHDNPLSFVSFANFFLPSPMQFVLSGTMSLVIHWTCFPATSPLPPNRFPSAQATTKSQPPPAVQSSPTTFLKHHLSAWWPSSSHALLPIVDVPLAPGKLRIATAGAPAKDDDDLIRDEDYVPPPSPTLGSQPRSAARSINVTSGKHGGGCSCFCF